MNGQGACPRPPYLKVVALPTFKPDPGHTKQFLQVECYYAAKNMEYCEVKNIAQPSCLLSGFSENISLLSSMAHKMDLNSSSAVVEAEWAEASFFLHKPTFRLPEFSLVNKESNLVHSIFNKFTGVPEIMEERNRVTFSSGFYLHGK